MCNVPQPRCRLHLCFSLIAIVMETASRLLYEHPHPAHRVAVQCPQHPCSTQLRICCHTVIAVNSVYQLYLEKGLFRSRLCGFFPIKFSPEAEAKISTSLSIIFPIHIRKNVRISMYIAGRVSIKFSKGPENLNNMSVKSKKKFQI
jgi:hypothetical protein